MDERSIREVAELHLQCLPHSLVGSLGVQYVRSFYRYVARSTQEILVVERDEKGHPVAAAVLSLAPATLARRLLLRTPLLVTLMKRLPRLIPLAVASARSGPRGTECGRPGRPAVNPQLILIFTAEAERGKGLATGLIREIEQRLRHRGVRQYEVRTEYDSSNPALEFYKGRGFKSEGLTVRFGTGFQVFTRRISCEENSSTSSAC